MDYLKLTQDAVFKYFENIDDRTLISFVETFNYGVHPNEKIAKLIDEFLTENDLVLPFLNREYDNKNKQVSFFRSSLSDVEIMNSVSIALLSLCFNRFKNVKLPKIVKLRKPRSIELVNEDGVKETHILQPLHSGYTLCGMYLEGDIYNNWEHTEKKPKCRNCNNIVKTCKTMEI